MLLLAALAFGYLLGSIPFGVILTRLAGTQDLRSHRLRQYRRDQCAAHRPQRAGGCHADRRRAQGHDCGACVRTRRRSQFRACRRLRRLRRASLSGLAQVQGRQGRRHLYRRPVRAGLADRASVLPDLARDRRAHPLFLARRPGRERGHADRALAQRLATGGAALRRAHAPALYPPSREHRAAAQRHRGQDRRQGGGTAGRV